MLISFLLHQCIHENNIKHNTPVFSENSSFKEENEPSLQEVSQEILDHNLLLFCKNSKDGHEFLQRDDIKNLDQSDKLEKIHKWFIEYAKNSTTCI